MGGVCVSVVVPVYDPGPHLDPLVDSLLSQTLPAGSFEVVFVDDGSTDGTGARLDVLAARYEHLHVVHIPNSGWPGRPRNVGIDASRGEYVLFVDHDDWLGPDALRRMHRHAVAFGADVVLVKEVGHGQPVPFEAFRRTVPNAVLGVDPLLEMLTPHKLFRRAFLLEHDLRFPEGRRRLEDHLFVVRAYLRAQVISILGDYPYYHWVKWRDGSNASARPISWPGYFSDLEGVLDVVEAAVAPGPHRDRLIERWYRGKVLARLGGSRLLTTHPAALAEFHRVVSDLTARRFAPALDAHLPLPYRARSALLRADRPDLLLRLAEVEAEVTADIDLQTVEWEPAGRTAAGRTAGQEHRDGGAAALLIRFDTGVHLADGEPPVYTLETDPDGGRRARWRPPVALRRDLPEALFPDELLDATAEFAASEVTGVVRRRSDRAAFALPTCRLELRWQPLPGGGWTPRVRGVARIDPTTALGGEPLTDVVDVLLHGRVAGWTFTTRLSTDRARAGLDAVPPREVEGQLVRPYWTRERANLSLESRRAAVRQRSTIRRLVGRRTS